MSAGYRRAISAADKKIDRFGDVQKRLSEDLVRRSLHLLKGKLDFAVHAFCRKNEINHASDLVRNEITYEIDAVAGLDLRCHRGAAKLAPD